MSSAPIECAKNRAHGLLAGLENALAAGEITEEQWYHEVAAVITPAYLAGDNPRSQSGHSGDEARWRQARGLILDAVDRDGTFLDVGCASGYLMECLHTWAAERGIRLEPYGLDIAPELADLARRRLPHWRGRIYTGNAISWMPPRRFDYVRTGLEYVPERRQRDLIDHLLREVVAPAGRLIIGTCNEETGSHATEARVRSLGFHPAGRSERPHPDGRLVYRVLWLDAADR